MSSAHRTGPLLTAGGHTLGRVVREQVPRKGRGVVSALWVAAVLSIGAGLAVALTPVDAGDTYCGTALYDTVTVAPCGTTMMWRRILAAGLVGVALVIVVVNSAVTTDVSHRRWRVLAGVFIALTAVAALATMNRLLQPARGEWCGSLVNRHRTYEPAIEHRCDELLASHRNGAVVAGATGILMGSLGLVFWRRGRLSETTHRG